MDSRIMVYLMGIVYTATMPNIYVVLEAVGTVKVVTQSVAQGWVLFVLNANLCCCFRKKKTFYSEELLFLIDQIPEVPYNNCPYCMMWNMYNCTCYITLNHCVMCYLPSI